MDICSGTAQFQRAAFAANAVASDGPCARGPRVKNRIVLAGDDGSFVSCSGPAQVWRAALGQVRAQFSRWPGFQRVDIVEDTNGHMLFLVQVDVAKRHLAMREFYAVNLGGINYDVSVWSVRVVDVAAQAIAEERFRTLGEAARAVQLQWDAIVKANGANGPGVHLVVLSTGMLRSAARDPAFVALRPDLERILQEESRMPLWVDLFAPNASMIRKGEERYYPGAKRGVTQALLSDWCSRRA